MRVTLIGEDGKKIGEVSIQDAERLAKESKKNLVMVAKNVYRIADSGKLKYERNQKKKQQMAHRRAHKIKEVKLGLLTDEHDLEVKSRKIRNFLQKGLKTKVTMYFKGRQIAFKEAGAQKLKNLVSKFIDDGLATIDREPSFENKNLSVFLTPVKKSKDQ